MSDELKNSGIPGEEQPARKPFSVNIPDDDFANDIPAPEGDVPAGKPHKVVRYVDTSKDAAKPEETAPKKKKGGLVGEFLAGAAAGAKSVGEGISAGVKAVSEKKPKDEKPAEEAPVKTEKPANHTEPAKTESNDETRFPEGENKSDFLGGIMAKFNSLPTKAVIGGAAALLIVLVAIILIAATSCSPSGDAPSSDTPSGPEISVDPVGPGTSEDATEEESGPIEVPTRKEQYVEAFNANNDVIGWLYVPGLEDIDAGVCFSYDKSYPYNKRDITGKKVPNSYWIDGAYYTHFRGEFGDTSEELSPNTVIFGHSDLGKENLSYTNDDPNGPLFSQLFKFKDPSFAEKTPYIYLSLPEEDTVWEVFSVFYNDASAMNSTFSSYHKKSAGDLWYIEPTPTETQFSLIIENMQKRSIYDYNVEVSSDDKIITLSTCTVGFGINNRDNYRFVIVAKLVEDPATEHIEKLASFTINADAPVPGTYKEEFDKYAAEWKPSEQ